MKITNIGHASFNARNMEKMKEFYCNVLGMKHLFSTTYHELCQSIKRRFGENLTNEEKLQMDFMLSKENMNMIEYFKLADHQYLELFHDGGDKKLDLGNRNDYYGCFKLNFEVDSIEEIKSILVKNNVVIERDIYKTVDGNIEIAVRDPDGNEVQFTEYSDYTRNKFSMIKKVTKNEFSHVNYTTQVAYNVQAATEMKKFYCEGLQLKNIHTITHGDLLNSLLKKENTTIDEATVDGLKKREDLPWLDFIEVAPHQYIEFFYDYDKVKKECRDLSPYYGYLHLCLEVEDIHKAWETVIANGLTPDTPINLGGDGSWQFWLVDPDGNRIELMQYESSSKQMR